MDFKFKEISLMRFNTFVNIDIPVIIMLLGSFATSKSMENIYN